jgi:hypothetical protein
MKTTTDKKHLQSKYTFIKYLNGDVEIESSDTYYNKPLVVRNTIRITTEESRIKLAKALLMSDVEFEKEVGIKRDMIHIANEKKVIKKCTEDGKIRGLVVWFKYDCEIEEGAPRFYKVDSNGVKTYYKVKRDVNGIKRMKWNYDLIGSDKVDDFLKSLTVAKHNHKRVGDRLEKEINWLTVERASHKKNRLELSVGIEDYQTITITFDYNEKEIVDKDLKKALRLFDDYITITGYRKLLVINELDAKKVLYPINYIPSVVFHTVKEFKVNDPYSISYIQNIGLTMGHFLNSTTGKLDIEKGVADDKLKKLVQDIYNLISISN